MKCSERFSQIKILKDDIFLFSLFNINFKLSGNNNFKYIFVINNNYDATLEKSLWRII